ncbi:MULTISPECIES: alpha/beta hydrolase [unclassified Streptomyces]|uniref:alpha/beta hydrolase n=1 Tax=unclassified Streptomyces TaxID=2593676 RepID=UPI0035DA9839
MIALTAVAGGTTGTTADAQPTSATMPAAVPQLDWHACQNAPGYQCATANMPLDHDQPEGRQIEIAVIKRPATDPAHRIGSLFFNPGGPGTPGVATLPAFYPQLPTQARARFDIVSFDPRGTGQSTSLQCFDTQQDETNLLAQAPAGFPVGVREEQTWINVYTHFNQACARNGGPILSHMSSANVARDMNLLRQAVGDPKLTYYGPSYGSYLGATYANLFPSSVRAMTLDGNIDARAWNDTVAGGYLGSFLREGSDLGSSATLDLFLSECGQVDTSRCAFSAGSAKATSSKFETLLSRLRAAPVTVSGTRFTHAATVTQTVSGLYSQQGVAGLATGWNDLAALLQQLWSATSQESERSAGTAPAAKYAGLEQFYGVICSDSPNPRFPQAYPSQAQTAGARAPHVGPRWAWMNEPCAQWPATDPDRYTGPFDRSTAPLLLVGVENDPATPYEASRSMAGQLANARLLTVSGGGHTTLFNKSDCADAHIGKYLVDSTLPPVGTVCAQNAEPF